MIVDAHTDRWMTRTLGSAVRLLRTRFHRKFAREIGLLRPLLPRGGTFLDVGANHGRYALELARLHGGDCRVLAFEPVEATFRILRAATRGRPNVECFNAALSDRPGERELLVPIHGGRLEPGGAFIPDAGNRALVANRTMIFLRQIVRLETLDGFAARKGLERLDFLKIDAQRHEPQIVAGGIETLDRHHPAMVIEAFPPSARKPCLDSRNMVEVLLDLGYRVYDLDLAPGGSWWTEPQPVLEALDAGAKHHDLVFWHPDGPAGGAEPEF